MDEQRLAEYFSLIQRLLGCPSGEEEEVLATDSHLIDQGLVAVMKVVAEQMIAAHLEQLLAQWQQLNNQVFELYHQGKFSEAVTLAEQALTLAESLYQGDHPDVASSLNNLAGLYQSHGRLSEAEPLYDRALGMYERLFDGDHPDVASSLNNLALLYYSQGRLSEAEPLYDRALGMYERLFDGDHPDVASSLNNLALLYYSQGRLSEAEPLYDRALGMYERLFDGDHPDVASSLNNLAGLYYSQGRLSEAEPLYDRALAMRQRLFNGDHPDVAQSLNNLAFLYQSQGRFSEAEPLYKGALEMRERLFKGDHPDVASSLNNLAALYNSQGRLTEAEPLYKGALEMRERLFKDDHPDIASSLNNLASLYQDQGRYTAAEPLYNRALKMLQSLFKDDYPDVRLLSLNNLASLYYSQGRYIEAETLYDQVLAMWQRLFKDDHPHVALSLNNLAYLYQSQGRLAEAFQLMQQAIQVENNLIRRNFAYSSEWDRLNYLHTIEDNYHRFLSLVCNHLCDSPAAVQTALDVVLQRKCLTGSALAAFNYAMYSDRYSHLKEKFERFRSLKEQIIHLTFNPPLPKPQETEEELDSRKTTHQKQLSDLETECEWLEKELAKQVPEIQLQEQISDRKAVALELPTGSALVEFVRLNVFDFPTNKWQPAEYIAFILPSQQPDAVEMIKLGDAEHIDNLIRIYRETVTSINQLGDLGLLRKKSPKNQPKSYIVAGIKLRQKIYDPLLQSAFFQNQPNLKHLYIAPDDSLNLVAFENLPLNETDNQLVRDCYTISYFSVGRDILRRKIPSKPAATPALIIANPNFDLGKPSELHHEPNVIANEVKQSQADEITSIPFAITDKNNATKNALISTLAGTYFQPLPATKFLGEIAAKALGVESYFQDEAVESKLTAGKCPRVLLIATHGYFVESKTIDNSHLNRFCDREINDPMMRSLLAFSGANNWLSGGQPHPTAGKGILLAQEVANLDLWGNELTILVACQTALGDTKAGEGVFGLRRAFPAAGSQTLIISLWSVPEKASMLLMQRFLDSLKEDNIGRADALFEAQNYLRNITIKDLQKSDLGLDVLTELVNFGHLSFEDNNQPDFQPLKHPYFWGAWVCQGETDGFKLE